MHEGRLTKKLLFALTEEKLLPAKEIGELDFYLITQFGLVALSESDTTRLPNHRQNKAANAVATIINQGTQIPFFAMRIRRKESAEGKAPLSATL